MKSFLSFLGLIATAALVCGVIFLVGFWVYWWFLGMFTLGATWFSLPYWVTFLIVVLVAVIVQPAMLLLAITGFVGWTWSLNWHWYTGLMVYLPTVAFIFISFIGVALAGLLDGAAQLWENTRSGFHRNNRRR